MAAATDNVGLFFGEDIFFAIGSIVLIQQVLGDLWASISRRCSCALWAIPTAIAAFLIHGARLLWLDRPAERRAPDDRRSHCSIPSPARCSRRWRCAQRDRPRQCQALRQCRVLGADGAEPAGGRPDRRFRQRAARAGAGRAGRVRAGRARVARDTTEPEREAWPLRLGNRLFLPALVIPVTALLGTLAYNYTPLGSRADRAQARDLRVLWRSA